MSILSDQWLGDDAMMDAVQHSGVHGDGDGALLVRQVLATAWYFEQSRDAIRRATLFVQVSEIARAFVLVNSGRAQDLSTEFMGSQLVYTLYNAQGQLQWVRPATERPRLLHQGSLAHE